MPTTANNGPLQAANLQGVGILHYGNIQEMKKIQFTAIIQFFLRGSLRA